MHAWYHKQTSMILESNRVYLFQLAVSSSLVSSGRLSLLTVSSGPPFLPVSSLPVARLFRSAVSSSLVSSGRPSLPVGRFFWLVVSSSLISSSCVTPFLSRLYRIQGSYFVCLLVICLYCIFKVSPVPVSSSCLWTLKYWIRSIVLACFSIGFRVS